MRIPLRQAVVLAVEAVDNSPGVVPVWSGDRRLTRQRAAPAPHLHRPERDARPLGDCRLRDFAEADESSVLCQSLLRECP